MPKKEQTRAERLRRLVLPQIADRAAARERDALVPAVNVDLGGGWRLRNFADAPILEVVCGGAPRADSLDPDSLWLAAPRASQAGAPLLEGAMRGAFDPQAAADAAAKALDEALPPEFMPARRAEDPQTRTRQLETAIGAWLEARRADGRRRALRLRPDGPPWTIAALSQDELDAAVVADADVLAAVDADAFDAGPPADPGIVILRRKKLAKLRESAAWTTDTVFLARPDNRFRARLGEAADGAWRLAQEAGRLLPEDFQPAEPENFVPLPRTDEQEAFAAALARTPGRERFEQTSPALDLAPEGDWMKGSRRGKLAQDAAAARAAEAELVRTARAAEGESE